MSLVALWKSTPDELRNKTLQQLISFAGDGQLKDGNDTSKEFREFLSHIPSSMLEEYADQCLSEGFPGSGFALQDLINQAGARLGFKVDYGLYRGIKGSIGYDGIWTTDQERTIIVEVKTTDTYNVNLDVIAGYRKTFISENLLRDQESSILYIVGRSDTGSLEAQVRGSRHAWDVRLISVEALFRLLAIKEELDEEETVKRIQTILIPQEFTKVDGIIDLVFKTASDITLDEIEADDSDSQVDLGQSGSDFRAACLGRLQKLFAESLVRQTAVVYSTPSKEVSVGCMFSKDYGREEEGSYWFGFHPSQQSRLEKSPHSFIAFGCGSSERIILVPLKQLIAWLPLMNTTDSKGRFYWHVVIYKKLDKYFLRAKHDLDDVEITPLLLPDSVSSDPSVAARFAV